MKKLLLIGLVSSLFFCLTACGGSSDEPTVPEVKEYTVTFNSNGGSNVASQTVKEGSTASKPANPTKDGFEFVNWELNDVEYNFSTPVTSNITLKASWLESVSNFTVSFVYGETTTEVEVAANTLVTALADPTDEDTHFYGWTLDDSASNVEYFDFTTEVNSNLTLTAHTKDVSELFAGEASSNAVPVYNSKHLVAAFDVLNGDNLDYKFNSGVVITLMSDINLDSSVVNNINYFAGQFKGTFDGAGFAINGLNLEANTEGLEKLYFGLFQEVTAAGVVKNVTFNNAKVVNMLDTISSDLGTGVVCGLNRGLIENITITNSVLEGFDGLNTRIGAVVGRVGVDANATVSGINNVVVSNTTVKGGTAVGGVVGHADYTKDTDYDFTISNVYVKDITLHGSKNVAGIAGYTRVSAKNCVIDGFTFVPTIGSSTIADMFGYIQQSSELRPTVTLNGLVSYTDYGKVLSSVKDDKGLVVKTNIICVGFASDGAEKTDVEVMTSDYVSDTLGFDLNLWTLTDGVLSIVR